VQGAPHSSVWPSVGRRFLVITGLTRFAISQSLLSILGDDPATLAFYGVEGTEVILLAALIALLPPVVLGGAVTATSLAGRRC
jgi:hypothetical protein